MARPVANSISLSGGSATQLSTSDDPIKAVLFRARSGNDGAVYVVAGSSGQTGGGTLDHPAMFISLSELGSMVLDIDGRRLDAQFLQADTTVSDVFTIIKHRPADLNLDGVVNAGDLSILLGAWGNYAPCPPHNPADLNEDCVINSGDLAILLGAWGS